jgi:hypothetical protein
MGGAPVLDGLCSMDPRNNQPNDGVGGGGGAVERIFAREERVGADVWSSFWVANGATKKYLNRDGDGASDFELDRRTQQPTENRPHC